MKILSTMLLVGIATLSTSAAMLEEDFESDPLLTGWLVHGDESLFHWDATNKNLRVTWNSAQPNSYFHRPLNNILTRDDDFQISAELWLDEVTTGTTTGKDSTFQLAFGLAQLKAVTSTNFLRGSGVNATSGPRNVIEFDYFPDSAFGFGATVSPTLISSNNLFASTFTFPMELPLGIWLEINLTYTAGNSTLSTLILTNGTPMGSVSDTVLNGSFTDFRVDTLAISSYSDAGQTAPEGSLLAQGVMDNFTLTMPDSPLTSVQLSWTNGRPLVTFQSRSNWTYTLERSILSTNWSNVSTLQSAADGALQLTDTNPPAQRAFYRVQATRP